MDFVQFPISNISDIINTHFALSYLRQYAREGQRAEHLMGPIRGPVARDNS
jgi:hypothetical protein